ncbi:MAG: hypothetical protein ABFD89_19430 [Bryobacteraceae bacterium]
MTFIAMGVKTYDNNMSPNVHKRGNEQFNAWLDSDAAAMVREIMSEYRLNKSDAARLLITEGLKARGKQTHEDGTIVHTTTQGRKTRNS